MKKRIYVVDDHPIMRRGYRTIIDAEADLEICGEASGAAEALEGIGNKNPDLALIDISLDGSSGIELIKILHEKQPHLFMLVVSMHDETLYAERALHAGASGYIMKSEVEDKVITAIHQVLSGHLYLSERMNNKMLRQITGRIDAADASPVDRLGDRELEVFQMIGQGLSTTQIAERMKISPKTVESHRARIKLKTGAQTTEELRQKAVLWVHQNQLI